MKPSICLWVASRVGGGLARVQLGYRVMSLKLVKQLVAKLVKNWSEGDAS